MKRFFDNNGCGSPRGFGGDFMGRRGFGFPMGFGGFGGRGGFGRGFGDDPRGGRGMGGMGGGMGRGPGGRGGRMFGQGDLRLVVLELVNTSPRHGYDIIKAIEELFGGQYAPSPGAVYPTLTLLEEQDFVTSQADAGSKKLYTITQAGKDHLAENRATVDGVMTRMKMAAEAMAGEAPPESIAQAMHTLKHALLYRRGNWSAEEASRVAKILQDAADAIARGPASSSSQPNDGNV
jgi:DNA-binding PadR family transcriptional regulator